MLERHWQTVLSEVQALETHGPAGDAYVANADDATLVNGGRWSEIRLYNQQSDEWDSAGCTALPRTCAILQSIASLQAVVPAGGGEVARLPGVVSVFKLRPQSSLVPHTGPNSLRITLHLALDVPEAPAPTITVGGEQRRWAQGKVLAFDDAFVHEVANPHPNASRTILLLNVWKAEFCAAHGCT
jgi:hypothetical protein